MVIHLIFIIYGSYLAFCQIFGLNQRFSGPNDIFDDGRIYIGTGWNNILYYNSNWIGCICMVWIFVSFFFPHSILKLIHEKIILWMR